MILSRVDVAGRDTVRAFFGAAITPFDHRFRKLGGYAGRVRQRRRVLHVTNYVAYPVSATTCVIRPR